MKLTMSKYTGNAESAFQDLYCGGDKYLYINQVGWQVFWGRLALGFSRGLWLGNKTYPQDTPGWCGLQAFMTPHEPEFVPNATRTNGIGTLGDF